jgi:sugar phosphate permease
MVMASAIPFIAKEFHLSSLSMGSVLSAFFVGYSLMQIPGGLMADRFGARRTVIAALVAWSLFTAATGLVGSFTAMLVVRALFGVSEGLFPPAAAKAIAIWFPGDEIGRANGIKLAATQLGPMLAPPLAAAVIVKWGWPWVFLSLLLPGLILVPIVWWNLRDSPPQTQTEKQTEHADCKVPHGIKFAVTRLLKMPTIMWCCTAVFAANLANWGLMNWLPTYLLQARGFSIARMGLLTPLPFFAGALGYLFGGYLSDRYFGRRRHVPIALGLTAAAVSTYLAAIAPSGELAVLYLAVTFFFLCIGLSGLLTLPLVIVPKEAVGVAYGVVGTCVQLAALVSPVLVGYALDLTRGNFKFVFYGLVSLFVMAALAATQIRPGTPSEGFA